MTPTELDLLHLRLQQIAEVLEEMEHETPRMSQRSRDTIEAIKRGMNPS